MMNTTRQSVYAAGSSSPIEEDVYEANRDELERLMTEGTDDEFNDFLDALHHAQDVIDFGYDPRGEVDDDADD